MNTSGDASTAEASARAHANIALVKYWGKRDVALNLPSRGSLSVTMGALTTRTTVRFDANVAADSLVVDGIPREGAATERAARVLDLVRERAGLVSRAVVTSSNSFPYGAGLASSASGMAALAVAASAAAGLSLTPEELSVIARRGSGSASRSLHGGFVEWRAGSRADGLDSHGVPSRPADWWDLRVVVALVDAGEKEVSSTRGMQHTEATSPYHQPFLDGVDADIEAARRALDARDLTALGRVAEASCLRMHAAMIAADPGLLYWRGATVELIRRVRRMRERDGLPTWFTIDAGPHVKVLTLPAAVERVVAELRATPGVVDVIESRVGGPARVE